MAISLSSALLWSLIAKTNALQKNVKRNGIWLDKAQRPSRKKLFVSNNPTRDATIVGPFESGIRSIARTDHDHPAEAHIGEMREVVVKTTSSGHRPPRFAPSSDWRKFTDCAGLGQ